MGIAKLVKGLGYGLDGPGFESLLDQKFLSSPKLCDLFCGTPILLYNVWRGLFPRGNAVGA
jgi:hypothetical protein